MWLLYCLNAIFFILAAALFEMWRSPSTLPSSNNMIATPVAHRQEIVDIQLNLHRMLYTEIDRSNGLFAVDHFNNFYRSKRYRIRIYAQLERERTLLTADYAAQGTRRHLEKLAQAFNDRYRWCRENQDETTILDLLHMLQDVLDIKRTMLMYVQRLNGFSEKDTILLYPKVKQCFDCKYVCEINMAKAPHRSRFAFNRLIALVIIKALRIGLNVFEYELDECEILKHSVQLRSSGSVS